MSADIDPQFAHVTSDELNFLVDFAIDSHDIYKTRKVDIDKVRHVFRISDRAIADGTIEKMLVDNVVVGFYCLVLQSDREVELTHLFVKAGLQNKGYGRKLFSRCLQKATSFENYTSLNWVSDPDSRNFYMKLGGKCVGEEANILNPEVPVPLFTYQLR
jgi:GNAT superfamily N-acetyltransferase